MNRLSVATGIEWRRQRQWLADRQDKLLRVALIVGIFLAAFVLGRKPSILYLGLIVGVGGLLVIMRWPPLGVLLTIIGGLAIAQTGPSGINVAVVGMGALLGIWIADMVIRRRRISVVDWPTTRAGLALSGVAILAFLVGQLPWFPTQHAPLGAQLAGVALYVLSFGVFLVVSNQVKTIRWLEVITYGFIAFASLHLLGFVIPGAGALTGKLFPYGSTGSLYWVWLAVLPFCMALFNRKLKLPVRAVLLGVALLTVYVVYVHQNDWKSGWVPVVIALAVALVLYDWRFGVAMALASLVPAAMLAQRALASDTYSYSTRVEAWQILGEIIKVNPILGLGPANYYYYTPLFPIRGYYVSFNSHSQYVDLVAQTGVLGLIVFFWFFFEVGRVTWRLYRTKASDPFVRAYVLAAAGGLVATLVAGVLGDWVIPFFYNVAMYGFRSTMLSWVFLGGLVALSAILKSSRVTPQTDATEVPGNQ